MGGTSQKKSSIRCRVLSGRGAAGGRRVSGSNEQHPRRHSKDNQELCQIRETMQRRHQREKKDGSEGEKEKTALGGGCPGDGRASEVNLAVQDRNVKRLLEKPEGSLVMESGMICETSGGHHH